MEAILVEEGTNKLYLGTYEDPVPNDDELLVSVKATALNRADLLQRKGLYPPPPRAPQLLGLEMAGVIEKVGKNVIGWHPGDRVSSLLPSGGYSEKVTIPSGMAMKIPDHFSFEQAAAIPEVFLTAYLNLIMLGNLAECEHVLIHAGASGVGTAAIQIAKEIGAHSIVTAGSIDKLKACERLGANFVINYKTESFSEKVQKITNGAGVNVVLDFVGASFWSQNSASLAVDGRWLIVGTLGGTEVDKVNLRDILRRRIHIIGSTLRSRSVQNKIEITKRFMEFASERFNDGRLRPIIDKVFDWRDANEAHEYMEENKNIGKIILQVG